jgi:UDP-glucose 4-epimerase
VNKFIYSSTAAVYGNKNKQVNEKDDLKPLSPYPKSKLKLENFLIKKKKDIRCIILRYFNVAGSDKKLRCGFNIKRGYNLILNLCNAVFKKKIFIINGGDYNTKDGTTIRDYIHVEDLAKIHLLSANLILKKKMFKILNCGYGYGFSVKEILKKFNFISKNKVNYKIGKRRKSDIVISISNPKKLIKLTNWKPKYNDLSYLLKSSLDWYKKNI